ncbi:MAG TPA: MDR family oxidoreductase [Acidimicrobiales bacterium]|nr:MDR family oxidoreductase [Acidimicrobiales bacterium]
MFKAIYLTQDEEKNVSAEIADLNEADLPEHNVGIDVEYSTVNYKDGLAIMGKPGVVRNYPMIPGIDLAGTVSSSESPDYAIGDKVVLNGWEVGEAHWGGLSQKSRLDASWLVPIPEAFSTLQAMAIGTAGYTAMLCILALEEHGVTPGQGPVLVTGASGGVGSTAVAILAKLGYEVVASTGRPEESGYLTDLGASEIVDRSELGEENPRPLQKTRWAGVVDAVGSHTLANAIAQTNAHGCVAACGLAQGADLPTSVMPFILRGVTLVGVNSVYEPFARRKQAWDRMATDLDPEKLEQMTEVVGLSDAIDVAGQILQGNIRGRVVVDVNA